MCTCEWPAEKMEAKRAAPLAARRGGPGFDAAGQNEAWKRKAMRKCEKAGKIDPPWPGSAEA